MPDGIKLRGLSRPQARRRFAELRGSAFLPQSGLTTELTDLRELIIAATDCVSNAAEIEKDRVAGMALYCALPPSRISLRVAADDSVWRYLSLDVFPDLVSMRNPAAGEEWFWNSRWRIWLKRVWWLIHLSWQGDPQSTSATLQRWTTDTVAQFIERPGRGFRIDLWRRIAAESALRNANEGHFRRVMKLNTALLATYEPTMASELLQPYVERLFTATASP